MNEPSDEYRDLQQQLDEAGRLWRPQHPGWDTLIARLPPQGPGDDAAAVKGAPDGASRRKSFPWRIMAMAAGILIAIVLGFSLWPGPYEPALAETLPIEVRRRGIQVTIFSKSEVREPTLFMPLVAPLQTAISPGQSL